ncbi:hypothetical protein IB270_33735 [Ensifer sp. ENS05]|uniref:transglutaminase family protein n=1 Tax=Ensifer sp. ENS05 TaxID=2769277 RepID=UPI00177D75A7|nr:transglutaminase family protein [Ensifer sp. ENS05]MBD9597788.1 hypothetical protein [Ensifer sp. ENS05]
MRLFAACILSLLVLSTEVWARSAEDDHSRLRADTEALFQAGRDLAEVKLAIDRMVDPTVNIEIGRTEIDRMADDVKTIVGASASTAEKLEALKRYIYKPGPWNNRRPFEYDLTDPLGDTLANRKLSRYLETRRGNCVTMPILFQLLGERLGLRVTLAEAPLHLFVKYTDNDGKEWNLETTSGGGFTRDIWYRQKLPMTDRAVEIGTYLRPLSREELIATMAAYLVEHYLSTGDYRKATVVADVLLGHYPNSAYLLTKKGTAYYGLLQTEVIGKFKRMEDIPPEMREQADVWYRENKVAFERAETLGWRPLEEPSK